jgi:molybdate transport system ATP-binding protein
MVSGGERQRCAICQALARHPRVLLLDEPFSALDAITRRGLREELKHLKGNMSFPIIYVTHDITEALYLADEILPVVEGKIDDQWMQRMVSREPSSELALRAAREPRLSLVY